MEYCNACQSIEAIKKITIGNINEQFCENCYIDFLLKINKELDERIEGIPRYYCLRCGHSWPPRKNKKPKICPKCKSPYWAKKRMR